MQIKVKLSYLRIAPRKVRQVVDMVRGKNAEQAQNILEFTVRKPIFPVLKLLKSALATAKHEFQMDSNNLYISKIIVDEGPKLKRFRPVSRGSAHPLWKRTSHVTLILDEIKPITKKKAPRHGKKETKEEPIEEVEMKEIQKTDVEKKEPDFQKNKSIRNSLERRDFKNQKGQSALSKMFRRKSI